MGAPGGAAYMGAAFRQLAEGLREALALFAKVGVRRGPVRLRDVPVLIKALSVRQLGVDAQAHQTLVGLAGRDLGREPGPWSAWWEARRGELDRRETGEREAAGLFHDFRNSVLAGQWAAVPPMLAERLIAGGRAEGVQRALARSARELRRAYRHAEVRGVRLGGARDAVLVDWGPRGFDFDELPLVREGGDWRFDRLPWGRQLRELPARPAATSSAPLGRHRWRPSVFGSAACYAVVFALIGLGAFGTLYRLVPWLAFPLLVAVLPATLVYAIFFGQIKPPRHLRELRRRLRGREA